MSHAVADPRRDLSELGYCVLPAVVGASWVERIREAMRAELERIGPLASLPRGAGLDDLTPDERALVAGNFPRDFKGSPLVREVLESLPLQAALRELLDSDRLYLHFYPTPRHVGPGNGRAAVPRHTDRQYNDHMSSFVTLWVPIDCHRPEQGGITVYPGTHRAPTQNTSRRSDDGLWFEATGQNASNGELLVLRPGDALVLDQHLLHESAPNRSQRTRLSIDYRLFGANATTSKHYYDLQSRRVIAPPDGDRHVRHV